jgi:D-sedoheptulose 7-phosphate isomerase
MSTAWLEQRLADHQAALSGLVQTCGAQVEAVAQAAAACIAGGGKLLLCGNGGSACDAMHIAGELVGRFVNDRRALPAIALSADAGIITAIANDYDYHYIFARQVEALGKPDDMLIGLSTSGQSQSVLRALEKATEMGMISVLFTSKKLGVIPVSAQHVVAVPSRITAHIQEAHLFALHSLCARLEALLNLA